MELDDVTRFRSRPHERFNHPDRRAALRCPGLTNWLRQSGRVTEDLCASPNRPTQLQGLGAERDLLADPVPDCARTKVDQPGAVALHDFTVDAQLAAGAQVLDHVPVHGALVLAAGVRVARAHREVHRAGDLLVEEDVPGEAGDPRVAAQAELAQSAGALVRREHLLQKLLALLGARLDDLARAEDEPCADDVVAEVDGRELGVRDHALGAVLERAVEDLSVRHVAEAGGDDTFAAFDPDREVRALARDADGTAAVKACLDLLHPRFLGVPVE